MDFVLSNPKVSVVILNYNNWMDTIECLESVLRNNCPNYQIILVDNNSPNGSMNNIKAWADGNLDTWINPGNPLRNLSYPPVRKPIPYVCYTKDEAENGGEPEKEKNIEMAVRSNNTITTKYPLVLIQIESNLGFAGGNNVGIRYSIKNNADYILLLNNDTVVDTSFLKELISVGEQEENFAVLGSVIADYITGLTVFTNSQISRNFKVVIKSDYLNSDKKCWETEMVSGASMMIRTDCLIEHSLFLDESLFLYGEEIDLSKRAKLCGLKTIMVYNSKVYHKGGASTGGALIPANIYYSTRNRIYLAKKLLNFKNQIFFWFFFVNARLCRVLEWLAKGKLELVKATFCAFRDGITGKMGK